MSHRFNNIFKDCGAFYQKLFDEYLDSQRPKTVPEDIVDILLQIRQDRDLTWNHVKAVLMNVFVGVTDAIAATVVWVMTSLMKNPEVTRKTQEEIRYSMKNKGVVDEDDLKKLQYLKAVVKETLRLQPPNPLLPRTTTERCILDGAAKSVRRPPGPRGLPLIGGSSLLLVYEELFKYCAVYWPEGEESRRVNNEGQVTGWLVLAMKLKYHFGKQCPIFRPLKR